MTGTLHANTIQKANGDPVDLTGQWANTARIQFDGTGTISITDSENCSSITDIGAGTTTVDFTNAHGSSSYSFCASTGDASNTTFASCPRSGVISTTDCRLISVSSGGTAIDVAYNSLMVSGDLA